MLQQAITTLERWLRIDAVASPMNATRGRAIYALTIVFVLTQALNLVAMTIDYGGWTIDHNVAIGAMVFAVGMMSLLRWCRNLTVYAFGYSGALIVGVAFSSVAVGVNSALLPMLVWVPFAAGVIAGWRTVAIGTAATLFLLVWLYWVSFNLPAAIAVQTGREFQRFVQTAFAILMSGAMAGVFSHGLRTALRSLQSTAERARRAEAAKSDFLARISHELRTPLGGVISLTDALAAADLAPRERELTETIRSSGGSLLAIVNDLLDLSKIEAGKLSIEAVPFSPRALVDSVGDTWREAACARGSELIITAENAPEWLAGDEMRIRQVLNNFVSNAIKFTEGGVVRLDLSAAPSGGGARLVFRVTDSGIGIPMDRQAAVFEPFEQAEAGTAKTYGGTGLGLPICRDLAKLMGGEAALERSGPDGTVFSFTVTLPLAEAPQSASADAKANLSGLRVLVAEDNAVNRMVAAEFLKSLSVTVVFAEDGEAAIEAARLGGFDAILMDKHMPKANGVEATKAIRAFGGEAARVPIIAVTADAMAGEREALLAEGMDGYLSKPLKLDALRETLGATVAQGQRGEAERASA